MANESQSSQSQSKPQPGQQKPSTPNQNPRDNKAAQGVSDDNIGKIGEGEDALDDDEADTETN
jgi:hypothetical protein